MVNVLEQLADSVVRVVRRMGWATSGRGAPGMERVLAGAGARRRGPHVTLLTVCLVVALLGAPAIASAYSTTTLTVGSEPFAIAVNPTTNKVYVANASSNTVTVIDGATNATTTIAVGSFPHAVAVNPKTNKVYVANKLSDTVTVIGR